MKVENGKKVKVHYTGKLVGGEVFDTSEGRDPIEFTVGQGMMIKGFEEGVLNMESGEKKTVEIDASEAYGESNSELFKEVEKSKLEGVEYEVGTRLEAQTPQGGVPVVVSEIKEDVVVLDMNHPLAGKKLIFDLELVEVVLAGVGVSVDTKLATHRLRQCK